MRRTRFMSILFLVLSASFFAMPQFRQAFTLPIMIVALDSNRIPQFVRIPERVTARWKQAAEANHDASMLAFLAIHNDDVAEATHEADLASAYEPKLTWVYYELFNRTRSQNPPQALSWIRKVQQFEPDNAIPYLAEAEYERETNPALKQALQPGKINYEVALQQKSWAGAMDKAFSAPAYDSFNTRRFDLERTILHSRGYDTPARMLMYVASYAIPNLLNIRQYADLRINYLGRTAEKAGKTKEALDQYWTVAHFGERMHIASTSLIEELIATAVRNMAYKPLSALLRSSGDAQAAVSVDNAQAALNVRTNELGGKDILSLNSAYVWNGLMVNVFLTLVVVFAVMTIVSIFYVNLKRWWRAHQKGTIYGGITIAENYLPVLLFIFCCALYITYYPYARNFNFYMTAQGNMHNLEAMFYNTISLPVVLPRFLTMSIGNPFVPYVWYALGGLAIVVASYLLVPARKSEEESKAHTAPAGN